MRTDTKPWYKQFWPWFLIAIPGSSVITGMILLTLAINGRDTLVREEWYKDGMAINQRLEKRTRAEDAGIKAFFTFDNSDNIVTLRLTNLNPAQDAGLVLELVHPTLAQRDMRAELYKTPDNRYFAKLNGTPSGFYYTLLSSSQGNWEIESQVNFANTLNDFELN